MKYSEHFGILQLFGISCNVIPGSIKDTPTETMRFVLNFHFSSHFFFHSKLKINLFSSEH